MYVTVKTAHLLFPHFGCNLKLTWQAGHVKHTVISSVEYLHNAVLAQDCTYLPTANNSVCPIRAISPGQTKHPIVTMTVFGDHWSDHQTALSAQTQSK